MEDDPEEPPSATRRGPSSCRGTRRILSGDVAGASLPRRDPSSRRAVRPVLSAEDEEYCFILAREEAVASEPNSREIRCL